MKSEKFNLKINYFEIRDKLLVRTEKIEKLAGMAKKIWSTLENGVKGDGNFFFKQNH